MKNEGILKSIVGIIAPIIAAASQESKQSSSRDGIGHSGGGSNFIFIGNNWGNSSPVNPSSRNPSSNEPIENYFYWSIGLSVVGIILALALEVAWVALMVAGLWVAGAGLLLLGQQVTAYAERQTEDPMVAVDMEPSASQYTSLSPSAPLEKHEEYQPGALQA